MTAGGRDGNAAAAVTLPAAPAIVATFVFVGAVVATPRDQFWAFGALAAILAVAAVVLRIPARTWWARLALELPFVAFALAMPFVGQQPFVHLGGVRLSEAGLWGAWTIVAKGTLGVAASGVLVATVPNVALIAGLERLRLPRLVTGTMAFMVRYGDVLADEHRRMRIARLARGDDPRWLWQAGTTARTLGALFVRSYERGERVHLAMVSRGYEGTMPLHLLDPGDDTDAPGTRPRAGLAIGAAAAVAVAVTASVVAR
ncbi:MAG: cobalt ECF transporter T component CbiQ [Acidimicrobiales bacterium]|nr:cobalt ECF transporter T component CbiQ [Acidimicrobiales bacterium]